MLKYGETTELIIKTFYDVYNELGHGFLEKIYQNSMYLALQQAGLKVETQKRIPVSFRGTVGEYYADIIVNGVVIIELKAAEFLHTAHECQLMNYLKASDIEIGLLFNFGEEPAFKRKMWVNDKKMKSSLEWRNNQN